MALSPHSISELVLVSFISALHAGPQVLECVTTQGERFQKENLVAKLHLLMQKSSKICTYNTTIKFKNKALKTKNPSDHASVTVCLVETNHITKPRSVACYVLVKISATVSQRYRPGWQLPTGIEQTKGESAGGPQTITSGTRFANPIIGKTSATYKYIVKFWYI